MECRLLGMAIDAGLLEVAVPQRKARQVVLERFLHEPQHVGIAPLVIRMAGSAFAFACVGKQAVKTGACIQVVRDLLMTIEA